jgi:hypothetical protein
MLPVCGQRRRQASSAGYRRNVLVFVFCSLQERQTSSKWKRQLEAAVLTEVAWSGISRGGAA